jgi:hypothetical protein
VNEAAEKIILKTVEENCNLDAGEKVDDEQFLNLKKGLL